MSELALPAGNDGGYRPNSGRQFRIALLLLAIAGLALWPALADLGPWLRGASALRDDAISAAVVALLLLGLGIVVLVNALRGLPRLTLSRDGVELETLFGTKWANWNSLGAFALTTNYVGQFRRRVKTATAGVTGPSVSENLRRKSKFVIPNAFVMPLDQIVADLNAQQRRVLGLSRVVAAAEEKPQDGDSFGLAAFTAPWLTFVMLAVLILVFAEEQFLALGPTGPMMRPSLDTLLALGALNRTAVLGHGEWYRLFMAPLLHGDLTHILGNGVALILAGFLLERLVGRAWYFAVFVVSSLSGALMSLALNPADVTSVGASGAIMGLFAASFIGSFRMPAGATRTSLQLQSARVLIPSLLPLATAQHIDYGAHLGGALGGTAVMLLLLKTWPATDRLPPLRTLAIGLAALGIVLFGTSFTLVAINYPRSKSIAVLIPPNQLPQTPEAWQAQAADLVTRYPQDPRAHLYRGASLAHAKNYAAAEEELRTALTQTEALRSFFRAQMENTVRAMLAIVLAEDHHWTEGREVALPACLAEPGDRPSDELRQLLFAEHLCNG